MSKINNSLSQLIQNFRNETKDGKSFLVVSGIPLQEQVLNNYLVPGEEISHFVEAWNGSPITLRHPQQNNGSANVPNPDVPIIGRFYNVSFDGKRMTGEYWFDDQLLQTHAPVTRSKIIAGQTVETSTGYWADEENVNGDYGGKAYEIIHRNLRPDHIALLPDEVGACSVQDGCGVNRNQVITNCNQCSTGGTCPLITKGKSKMNVQELLEKLGVRAKVKINTEEGKEPTFELEETTPAPPTPVSAPAIFSTDEIAALKSLAATAPVLQNAAKFAETLASEAKTRKDALIAQVKANSANPFDDVALNAMTEDALVKFNAHLNTNFMGASGMYQNTQSDLIAVPPDTFSWSTQPAGGK